MEKKMKVNKDIATKHISTPEWYALLFRLTTLKAKIEVEPIRKPTKNFKDSIVYQRTIELEEAIDKITMDKETPARAKRLELLFKIKQGEAK